MAHAARLHEQLLAALRHVERWSNLTCGGPVSVEASAKLAVPWCAPSRRRVFVPEHLLDVEDSDLYAHLVHESAHLVLFAPSSRLLSEGFAVAASYALAEPTSFPFPTTRPRTPAHRALGALRSAPTPSDYTRAGARASDLLVTGLPTHPQRLAYAVAGSFVSWLIARGGIPTLESAFSLLRAGRDEASALREVYGESLATLERAWREAVGGSGREDGAAARSEWHPPSDTEWQLTTDEVVGGDSRGGLERDGHGFHLGGTLGERGSAQFLTAYRLLRRDRGAEDLSGARAIRFEARGDGKVYQLAVLCGEVQPGREPSYCFASTATWQRHVVPLNELCAVTGSAKVEVQRVRVVKFRAIGYRGQPVSLSVKDVTFC